jgi:hypothetical protein
MASQTLFQQSNNEPIIDSLEDENFACNIVISLLKELLRGLHLLHWMEIMDSGSGILPAKSRNAESSAIFGMFQTLQPVGC